MNRGKERAGVLIVRDGRLALIKRFRAGQHYYAIPGGGIEKGETIAQAAEREAEEELGVNIALGQLRVSINHREEDGTFQRQHYFDATIDTDDIVMSGPELTKHADYGTYEAVWLPLEDVPTVRVLPQAVANLVATTGGVWRGDVIEIDEAETQK